MTEPRKKYDPTVARIAGNILSGLLSNRDIPSDDVVVDSFVFTAVHFARAIVAEVERTEITKENGTLAQAGHNR
jgi:hypothetical protein